MLKKIALIVAMKEEAIPILESLHLQRCNDFGDPALPFEHYIGTYSKIDDHTIELLLSLNGKDSRHGVDNIGTEPATLNAYITLRHFRPCLCINVGTAGGFLSRGAQIGDAYLSSEAFRFHDRRIPIPGFDEYGLGNFPAFSLSGLAESIGAKEGIITTGNSLDCSEVDWRMMERTQGSAKEMEAAGIAWVAHLLGVPFIALKAITDLVDSPESTQEQFLRNFKKAGEMLQAKTLALIQYFVQAET